MKRTTIEIVFDLRCCQFRDLRSGHFVKVSDMIRDIILSLAPGDVWVLTYDANGSIGFTDRQSRKFRDHSLYRGKRS